MFEFRVCGDGIDQEKLRAYKRALLIGLGWTANLR
jgi:hypothetical protein